MSQGLSRRGLLGAGALGIAATALPFGGGVRAKRPKNIVFMVSDGMSLGVPAMLDHFLQLTEGEPSFWRELMEDPAATQGLQDTRSLSSLVADSAAASSAWGAGRHVWSGMINAYPDGTKLRPLYDILGEHRMRRGLVSTATITHATPAGFAASIPNRDDEHIIAQDYLAAEIDVILGGGDRFFAPGKRKDGRDLYAEYGAKGYAVAKDKASLEGAKAGKLLGVFSNSHVPYFVDRQHDPALAGVPGLEQMATVALDRLKGGKEGFILQVEAARVDHAAHANDFAGLLYDQLEFDRTIRAVVEWARKDGETLVVITSDHGNSNPGLDGAGDEYYDSTAGLLTVAGMTRSYESMLPAFATGGMNGKSYDAAGKGDKINPTVPNVQGLVERDLGVKLTPEEAQIVVDGLTGKSPLRPIDQYSLASSALSIALNNHTRVGWTGRQHTDDYTLVTAVGPGREAFAGLNANVSFHEKLLSLRGLKGENPPQMTKEDALRAMDKAKQKALGEAVEAHWL